MVGQTEPLKYWGGYYSNGPTPDMVGYHTSTRGPLGGFCRGDSALNAARPKAEDLGVLSVNLDGLDFSEALDHIKDGETVRRAGWNGKGQSLRVQRPDDFSAMSSAYIYITTTQGDRVPWLASQGDLFAEDWEVIG